MAEGPIAQGEAAALTRRFEETAQKNDREFGIVESDLTALRLQVGNLDQKLDFTVPTVVAVTPVFRDVRAADGILGLQRTTRRAVAADCLTGEAAQRWLDHLARGPFFAAVTFYIVAAEATPVP
ncbi:hypothetical protein [Streptomyces sp. WAC 06725]|uniref:hypothetical protein n=1 Tax=Streptomyces sp. WAC 06725 TaxID=2203209 RepID=UPI00163D128F